MQPQRYPFAVEPYASTAKTQAMQEAGQKLGVEWMLPPLAVAFANPGAPPVPGQRIVDDANLHGVERYTCRLVGECNIGCNFGAKETLDLNYLSRFKEKGGDIRTLCEVRSFAPRAGGGFEVKYVRHSADAGPRDTSTLPLETITCDRLVISAGSFGSTFLLLRNRDNFPALSDRLGTQWCGNGDLLGFLAPRKQGTRRFEPAVGAVITSALRYDPAKGRGYYIEDGGYPSFVSWLLEVTDAPGTLRRALRFLWRRIHDKLSKKPVSNLSAEMQNVLGDGARSSQLAPAPRNGTRRARRPSLSRGRLPPEHVDDEDVEEVLRHREAVDAADRGRDRREVRRRAAVVLQARRDRSPGGRLPDGALAGARRRRRALPGVRLPGPLGRGRIGAAGAGRAESVADDRGGGGPLGRVDARELALIRLRLGSGGAPVDPLDVRDDEEPDQDRDLEAAVSCVGDFERAERAPGEEVRPARDGGAVDECEAA